MEINLELKKFKDERGLIMFDQLLSLPLENRIFKMAEKDLASTIKIITVALTLAMETFNVARKMNNFQILDLAETIVDDAGSDKIALEDLMLFLQKLTRGEYPELYEGMDQVKFMARFNQYRDDRWDEGVRLRDAKHEEFKKLGDANDFERYNPKDTSAFGDMMKQYRTKTQIRRDEQRERKNYNN